MLGETNENLVQSEVCGVFGSKALEKQMKMKNLKFMIGKFVENLVHSDGFWRDGGF